MINQPRTSIRQDCASVNQFLKKRTRPPFFPRPKGASFKISSFFKNARPVWRFFVLVDIGERFLDCVDSRALEETAWPRNNDTTGHLGGYPAGAGSDACSGWGCPDGAALLAASRAAAPEKPKRPARLTRGK